MEIKKTVFNNLPYPLPLFTAPYFERPVLTLNLEAVGEVIPNDADITDGSKIETTLAKKQQDALDKAFDASFTKELFDQAAPRIKRMQKTITATTNLLDDSKKNISQAQLEKVVAGLNKEIEAFAKELQEIMQEVADKAMKVAIEASFKAMKIRIKKAKYKCIAKAVAKVLLKVTSKALDKVGDALSATGKGAVLGAIVKGLAKMADVAAGKIDPWWPTTANALKQVETAKSNLVKDTETIERLLRQATPQQVKGKYVSVSPDTVKLIEGGLARILSATGSLKKTAGQLDKFKGGLLDYARKLVKDYQTLAKGDVTGEVAKKLAMIKSKLTDEVGSKLKQIDEIQPEVDKVIAAYKDMRACFDAFYNVKKPDNSAEKGKAEKALASFGQRFDAVVQMAKSIDLDGARRTFDGGIQAIVYTR